MCSVNASVFVLFTHPEPADINSPEVAKTPGGGSGQGKDENVVNGHKEGEANPFAEYMWMENEEEYNRQVSMGQIWAKNVQLEILCFREGVKNAKSFCQLFFRSPPKIFATPTRSCYDPKPFNFHSSVEH